MDPANSLDKLLKLIAATLTDIQKIHGGCFDTRASLLTFRKICKRTRFEGVGFLTKSLPSLGKAFDKALSASSSLNAVELGLKPMPNSKLPMLFGELFKLVLDNDGNLLSRPCPMAVASIRLITYLFYKYELPYDDRLASNVVDQFVKTESDISASDVRIMDSIRELECLRLQRRRPVSTDRMVTVAFEARKLLNRVFQQFDPTDIRPRHGPGAVSTKERLWGKYQWLNVSDRIASVYPIDQYFYCSLGHVCDRQSELLKLGSTESSARVILVPKDSRGPRLISCEPVDFQWIQQGLGRAIMKQVEKSYVSRYNVFFADQGPNQRGALLGSRTGKYATLDLKEASDRVSLNLVRLLFPGKLFSYLENCRSLTTVLPDGTIVPLQKFAPMGSALCFPILALTVWAILTAGTRNGYVRERILVYGDDVIVPTAYAEDAIELLEIFGLLVNQNKSCLKGLFRESCGVDAFNGINVTPVRIRTVWASSRRADVYTSWISYANSFYDRHFFTSYELIVSWLTDLYGQVPDDSMNLMVPSLRVVPDEVRPGKRRYNRKLQKLEYRVWDVRSKPISKTIDGWSMLLRYFCEQSPMEVPEFTDRLSSLDLSVEQREITPFSVRSYTQRDTSMLVSRWR